MKRKNLYRNLIIILICIFVPIMIAIGAASWYMISESSIKPKYNPNSAFYLYLNNQTTTYNGAAQLPKSTNDNVSFDKDTISFICFKKNSEGKFVEYEHDAPIDAGDYLLRYSDRDDKSGYAGSDVLFKINKADLELVDISVKYTQFTNEEYFSTSMDTSNIQYNYKFTFNNVEVDGTVKYSHSTGLSVGNNKMYDYIFTPTSDNFNFFKGEVSITTYATVKFYNDDPSSTLLKTEYVEQGGKISSKYPFPQGIYKDGIDRNLGQSGFEGWYYNEVRWDVEKDVVTDDISLYANWYYSIYTLTLNNVDAQNNNTDVEYTIKDLPIEIENPNLDIKYFKRWEESNDSTIRFDNITITLDNYNSFKNVTYKAIFYDIIVINTVEINYSTSNRSFNNLKTEILKSEYIKLADESLGISDFSSILNIEYIHDGFYYYGDLSKISDTNKNNLTTTTNIAGSTYITSFKFLILVEYSFLSAQEAKNNECWRCLHHLDQAYIYWYTKS